METDLTKKVDTLKGIGPKRADALNRLGIVTLRDLLFYFPRNQGEQQTLPQIYPIIISLPVKSDNVKSKKRKQKKKRAEFRDSLKKSVTKKAAMPLFSS